VIDDGHQVICHPRHSLPAGVGHLYDAKRALT